MAITLAQPNGGSSSAASNPTLQFGSRLTAGNFLLAACVQQSFELPGLPTDTSGNVWQVVGQQQHPSGLAFGIYRVRSAIAARPTITFPTIAPSAFALQEFAGVRADANVGTETEIDQPDSGNWAWATGSDQYAALNPAVAGAWCEAFVFALGTITFTLTAGAGWSVDNSINAATLSFQLIHQVSPGTAPLTAHWTTPSPVTVCLGSFTLSP